MKFPSWYGIGVGALILLQWVFFLTTNSVPELRITPWEIGAHMFAKLSLALALIVGGIGMLRSMHWGRKILLIGLGMAIYSGSTARVILLSQVNGHWSGCLQSC